MDLRKTWEKYREESTFNYSVLPESLKNRGECVEIEPKTLIVSRGAFPQEVFFILEGTAAGIREYADGNEYSYFQLDKSNGSIGLLELFARKDRYVATIVSLTKMKLMKIDSEVVYGAIMEDVSLLRRCTVLLADELYQRSGNDGILYYFQGIDRVRYYLTSYYEEHKAEQTSGKVIVLAEYQEIASSIGVSVRTVGRNLRKLKEGQEIGSFRKKITVTEEQYRKMLNNLYLE